jgi:hypothetical protein
MRGKKQGGHPAMTARRRGWNRGNRKEPLMAGCLGEYFF